MAVADLLGRLRALGYTVFGPHPDDPRGVVAVRGFGVALSVSGSEAERMLATLLEGHAERHLQATRPDVHRARAALEGAGYTVTLRGDRIVVKKRAGETSVTPDGLVRLADHMPHVDYRAEEAEA